MKNIEEQISLIRELHSELNYEEQEEDKKRHRYFILNFLQQQRLLFFSIIVLLISQGIVEGLLVFLVAINYRQSF